MEDSPIALPVGPWLPDLPDFGNPGSINVRNVYPRTSKSYGPVASAVPYSTALAARCQGAAGYLDQLGNVNLFSGTTSKLYRLIAGSAAWADVSKVGGYHVAPDEAWCFNYMNGLSIACNYNDPIQSFDLQASALFADLSASAPRARYAAVVKNFLVVGNTFDSVDADQPQRVWWSALNNPTSWPTPGTTAAAQVQSSFNDLLGDNGPIMGIAGNLGNADGAVFMQKAVCRMIYSGPPATFDFPPAVGVVGCVAPYSIVPYGNRAYYLGPDGFYAFDGAASEPIGADQFDKTVYADLDQNYMDRVVGTADPINRVIIWAYPGQGNVNGNPNRLLFYNWQLKRASVCDVTCETIARLLSVGYSLDELYTVLGYTLDNLPAPLDSRVWTGGQLLLGMFDANHKLNYLTGPNLAPTVDTTEIQPFPGGRAYISGARPLVDGGVPSVAIGRRETLQQKVTFTAATPVNGLGRCPQRCSARYLRGRLTLPAGTVFTHIMGIEADGGPAGAR